MTGTKRSGRWVVGDRAGRARRKGAILVLSAFLMIAMMAMLALAIDVGYMMTVRTELQRATDAAALAGAGALVEGTDEATMQALSIMAANSLGGHLLVDEDDPEQRQLQLAAWLEENPDDFNLETGHWDPDAGTFSQSASLPSTIKIATAYQNAPLFFAKLFGQHAFSVTAESIARYQPRDIVLVLDFSASMNDDSELRRIYELGEDSRAAVEANLLQIYQDLGSPTYGNMQFEPAYISSTRTSTIKSTLGLYGVSYPYASGSWNDYISYVKSSSSYSYVNRAGYRKKYGYLTLINYWLEKKPKSSQSADLWMVSAQPVSAVKDAVDIFMDYIQEVDVDDRVGLVVYNSPSQNALLEQSLTGTYSTVTDIVDRRQAGHYDVYTNIGAGIREARLELRSPAAGGHARPGAFKMIVLMTDGRANRPSNNARGYAIEQAGLVKSELNCPIVTISLGNGADTGLMEEIAELTDGIHFNVPGGQSVGNYRNDLLGVFRLIANDRPLTLVK